MTAHFPIAGCTVIHTPVDKFVFNCIVVTSGHWQIWIFVGCQCPPFLKHRTMGWFADPIDAPRSSMAEFVEQGGTQSRLGGQYFRGQFNFGRVVGGGGGGGGGGGVAGFVAAAVFPLRACHVSKTSCFSQPWTPIDGHARIQQVAKNVGIEFNETVPYNDISLGFPLCWCLGVFLVPS